MKEYLPIVLLLLFAWSNRDRIPVEYQFWKQNETWIRVRNQSDQDITGVILVVWSTPHALGDIKKGTVKDLRIPRKRDITEVVIRLRYGSEVIERHTGTLDESNNYQMTILLNFGGVVRTQSGVAGEKAQGAAQSAH